MCIICTMATPSDPAIHNYIEPMNATFTETVDAADNTSTTYTMSVGDTFEGTIADTNDEDWVAINLTAGNTYTIDLQGGSGGGSLNNPFVGLYDSSGNWLSQEDGFGTNSVSLTYTANESGTYYIEADAFDSETGTYELSATEAESAPVAT
ncbi:pre-peptidase C-terminal domain-containing protein, partial [Aquicoccus sp.]|uniref:pre-peptidase C-terminal domain-containing protein n=1 Tax=Aquicoccus sp. TaxID=2055851 RepID=UPI003562F437